MVVYHGSDSNFNTLRILPKFSKNGSTKLNEGYGIYFSLDRNIALSYGKFLYTLEINDKYFKSYKKQSSCIKLVKYIVEKTELETKVKIGKYINSKLIGSKLYLGNLSFSNLAREFYLILDNEYEFYNSTSDSLREKIYRKIRSLCKELLKVYMFNYNIPDIGIIKDVKPEIVRIIKKERV